MAVATSAIGASGSKTADVLNAARARARDVDPAPRGDRAAGPGLASAELRHSVDQKTRGQRRQSGCVRWATWRLLAPFGRAKDHRVTTGQNHLAEGLRMESFSFSWRRAMLRNFPVKGRSIGAPLRSCGKVNLSVWSCQKEFRANCEIAQVSRIIRRFGEFRGIRSRLPVY